MTTQAPYEYTRDYYQNVLDKAERFPRETSCWMSHLASIRETKVLNIGCGPTFYDYLPWFGSEPQVCTGLDINQSTFDFLHQSQAPELLRAKRWIQKGDTHVEMICDDVFNCEERLAGQYDCILGVGFFAGFHNNRFDELMYIMKRALVDGGKLIKISWHGPHRSQSMTWKKLQYCYESVEFTDPDKLVSDIERNGFILEREDIIECDPAYGWNTIQACHFKSL